MKYLGIDFGLAHVGLAIADSPLAEPLAEKKYARLEELFNYLKSVCADNLINQIIVGLPEGGLAPAVKDFGARLEQVTGVPVAYQDEVLSTVEAKAKLLAAGVRQKKRRHDHRAAAALILQNYLDMIKSGGK